jgi:hypothetical protein
MGFPRTTWEGYRVRLTDKEIGLATATHGEAPARTKAAFFLDPSRRTIPLDPYLVPPNCIGQAVSVVECCEFIWVKPILRSLPWPLLPGDYELLGCAIVNGISSMPPIVLLFFFHEKQTPPKSRDV